MKIMKKFSTLLLTGVLMLAMSVPAFAAEPETGNLNEVTTTKDLAVLTAELEDFVALNPDSTEAEQDAHLTQFIQNGGLNRAATYGIGDYIPGYNNLNPAERELVKKHPVQATKVFTTAQSATDYTISTYGKNGWQDNSDAFRHCLWNALMKKAMDASAAEEWATAHEYESSGLDKSMDWFNNSIGRSIDVSNKSEAQIVSAVKTKVSNGSCRRIINNKLVATNGDGMK